MNKKRALKHIVYAVTQSFTEYSSPRESDLVQFMGMNECLTTPQHKKQIGYWVSEKGQLVIQLKN